MLEQTSLLLRPWVPRAQLPWVPPDVTPARWIRVIVHPATSQRLGFAALRSWPRLWFWLGTRTIQVLENDDACLLMALHRPWGIFRMWQVRDAEENPVGTMYRETLLNPYGARLAAMKCGLAARENVLLSAGVELGSWQRGVEGDTVFHFGQGLESNPFARMMALAAALVVPPLPR